jgi:hypothetical protein
MNKLLRRGALGIALSIGVLAPGCAEDKDASRDGKPELGRVRMNLQQQAAGTGRIYRLRQATFDVDGFSAGPVHQELRGDDNPESLVVETFLPPGSYQINLRDGWFVERVDPLLGTAVPVPAQLLASTFQTFTIESNGETSVLYPFLVDSNQVTFGPPGRVSVGVGIIEQNEPPPPTGPLDRRTLIETNAQALSLFDIRQAFEAIQVNANLPADPDLLYHQVIDSYASAPGRLPGAVHCGDETTNGQPSLNGYPIQCDRLESLQFDNIGSWFPTAVVNRLDLAPADGTHCGQQRIIFANNAPIGNSRMFTIFEAQIPNPHPECGIEACRPLAELWRSLREESDQAVRGKKLFEAFFTGSPELAAGGFGPFLNLANFSVGTGSVRTNNFDDFMWTLRQFKLMADPIGQSRVVPFPVSEAPHGELWDDNSTLPAAAQCRTSFLNSLNQLLTDDPARMAFVVDSECLDAESPNDFFTQDYRFHLGNGSGAFRSEIQARIQGTGLTPEDIAARAQFAGSCIGCHEEATGNFLGNGVFAPFSNGFVHVDESFTEDCGDGTQCFRISPAMRDVFFPLRQRVLDDLLAIPPTCGSAPADGGAPPPAGGGAAIPPPQDPPPSAVVTPDESVPDLVKEDDSARKQLEGETLGGQPAGVNH